MNPSVTVSPQTLDQLGRADHLWQQLKSTTIQPIPQVIHTRPTSLGSVDWDVVICGGTLGILIGAALAQQGWRVALLERGTLRGREQEWNISRSELQSFLELELLTESELDQAMVTCYNPARLSFLGGPEFWVRDVLNIGVDPVFLLECLKTRFRAAGGHLLEQTGFEQATIHPDGVEILAGKLLTTRLLIDAMGHFSPIVKQARRGHKPEGVCLVVGSCAQGLPPRETGDLITTFTPIQNDCQYFWEAFPARDGRTTYLFTYVDPHPERISLTQLFQEYLCLLPQYQQVDPHLITFVRTLFGFFPSYRQSPLQYPWDRILAVGDSSGSQSPLSFGGFGAMVRHLQRLQQGIQAALESDSLAQKDLALLQPYQPNLSVAWLFQKTMSVGVGETVDPHQINHLLSTVFQAMFQLGDPVVKPFLQDVLQWGGLSQTLAKVSLADPGLVIQLMRQVGAGPLLNWMKHYSALGLYSLLNPLGQRVDPFLQQLPPAPRFAWQRRIQALQFGSGGDLHRDHERDARFRSQI
jgi:lycopene cyclase CruP